MTTAQRARPRGGRLARPDADRFAIVLVRPETPENIGLAARGMANTGFRELRLVGLERLAAETFRTAVHAESILDSAHYYPSLKDAVRDRHVVLASTARPRGDFPLLPLDEAAARLRAFSCDARIGLVFGNERTGLTMEEIGLSNIRFHIPQAARQPSYNLGVAVTLTLFHFAAPPAMPAPPAGETPLTSEEQEACGARFRDLLEGYGFMRDTNRAYIEARVRDIFRRMTLSAKDRDVILAMFRRALEGGKTRRGHRPEETT